MSFRLKMVHPKTLTLLFLITAEILKILSKSGIPHSTSISSMAKRIQTIYERGQKLLKQPSNKCNFKKYHEKLNIFKGKLTKLFDIPVCKCKIL